MGLVYLAVHEKLKKPVALKVLGTIARSQREAIARFEREAVAAANLKHPNIAEATDFGQLPDGGLYLVMEYVEGTTLRQLLAREGKLAPPRALAILQQVGAALAAAHARDVVHRDLKPENVIVTGGTDAVKVIDFGIAKVRSATFGSMATGLTTAGSVFGSAQYMSPEQVMGQTVDARADQYALGVLAFELLTGEPPFETEDTSRLMMMHVGAPIPSTREKTPGLPPDVDAVTSKMLAKLPDERFASVTDAMQALAGALTAPTPQPAAAAPSPMPMPMPVPMPIPMRSFDTTLQSPRREMPARRNVVVIAIAAAVTFFLLVSAGVIVFVLLRSSSWEETSHPAEIGEGAEEDEGREKEKEEEKEKEKEKKKEEKKKEKDRKDKGKKN